MTEFQSRFFQVNELITHPTGFKWIFTEYDLMQRGLPFEIYKSEEFTLLETNQKCFATLELKKNCLSRLKIHIAAYKQPITLLIIVCLIGKDNKKYESTGKAVNINEKDFKVIFCLPALNHLDSEIIVNNSLTILCEIYDEKVSQFQTNLPLVPSDVCSFNQKLKHNFKTIYESKTLCDVIFKIGNEVFEAHTLVLKAFSPYFVAMFGKNGMKEQNERVVDLTDDTDITGEIFKNFLDYVYGVKSVEELEDCVPQLLILADKYQIMKLRNACESFLCNSLNENNIFSNLEFSIKYDFKTLKKASVLFVKDFSEKIKKDSKEFQELFKKQYADLFEEFL